MREKKEINIQIGEQIRLAREQAKLTQEQFAERIEVSPQYISDLERGVVVCETADSAVYAIPEAAHALFGPESYHGQDYGFYYMNLRENAKVRIEAFKNK